MFRDVWAALLQSLKATSAVTFSSDPVSARRLLLAGDISSVLVVAPRPFLSLSEPWRVLRGHVRNFAERQAGTVLFCGTFAAFVEWPSFDLYFANEWKLPWRAGSYTRSTLEVNPHFNSNGGNRMAASTFDPVAAGLAGGFRQKALLVRGIEKNARVYVPGSGSHLDSRAGREVAGDMNESPIVFQCYGKGHVGYLGDVNGDNATTKANLAMCGVTSTTRPPQVVAGSEDPRAGGLYCSGCGKQGRIGGNAEGEKYKCCFKCKMCYYCSARCRKAHWQASHKEVCKLMKVSDNKVQLERR